jgi:hypothetical protein
MFEQVEATMQIFSEGMIELSAKVKALEDSWLQTERCSSRLCAKSLTIMGMK